MAKRKKKNLADQTKIRAFIAAEIGEEARQAVGELLAKLRRGPGEVKWVRAESMHLTLRFLGNISEEEVERAGKAMSYAFQDARPFKVRIRGWGTFPPGKPPRVIWLGLDRGAQELAGLFNALEERLLELGFPPADKAFSPHLTLGRVRSSRGLHHALNLIRENAEKSFGEFTVERIVLFQSQLRPEGALYTPLKIHPLQKV